MSVPADGVIVSGRGALDESALTGESLPADKAEGAEVRAERSIRPDIFTFKVTRTGGQTLLSQIISLVEEASASKAPIGRLADKVSGVFVPVVIALALLTAAVWLLCGYGWSFALGSAGGGVGYFLPVRAGAGNADGGYGRYGHGCPQRYFCSNRPKRWKRPAWLIPWCWTKPAP